MKVGVIGGGIVGLATANEVKRRYPKTDVELIEKETTVGRHQSSHNSGVLHAGLYYKPGSFKAKLAVSGIRRMTRFCEENGIEHEVCGKLVVATNDAEATRIDALFERGTANGLSGLKILSPDAMHEIEPHVNGVKALRVPEEGIVNYPAVCAQLQADLETMGGRLLLGRKVEQLQRISGQWQVRAGDEERHYDFLINTAGLYCDRICELSGMPAPSKIIPFRGQYFKLRKDREFLVKHLIYPVPDPKFPFLGVHFTRLIHGGIEAGPNAVFAFAREGYRFWDLNPSELVESVTFSGFRKFLLKHWGMCWNELLISLSKDAFCRALQQLVPDVQVADLEPGGAGVRAQAMNPEGFLEQDFLFKSGTAILHVLNAPSPGATASLSIAEHIVDQLNTALEA